MKKNCSKKNRFVKKEIVKIKKVIKKGGKKIAKFNPALFEKTKKRVFGMKDAKKEDMGKC
jgi:hypothetical protein